MTNYFCKAKEHGVQWQLNRSYRLTCTSGCVAAQFNQHGNCATAIVDTVVLVSSQLRAFLNHCRTYYFLALSSLMSEAKYIGECCGCFTACDIKRSRSIAHAHHVPY